jgi:hypothetical protein
MSLQREDVQEMKLAPGERVLEYLKCVYKETCTSLEKRNKQNA